MSATPEQIAKLPKWAQEHIDSLTREREQAIRALNKYVDDQTKSPMFIDELESLGENRTASSNGPSFKRRYIQSHRLRCEWAGIGLDVSLDDNGIRLQWSGQPRDLANIALVPESYQQVRLIAKDNMR